MNMHMFDDSSLELRINQLRGIQKLAEFLGNYRGGKLSGYFRQPTGSGKTILFGIIARLLSVKTLVLVPRTNLVQQTINELRDVVGFSNSEMGKVVGGTKELDRNITVATYQSHLSRMKKDADYRKMVASCELIICDEAHRSLGGETQESIRDAEGFTDDEDELSGEFDDQMTEEEEKAEEEVLKSLDRIARKALKLGFTATPELASKHVEEDFGVCIAAEKHSDMIAAGICVPYKLIRVGGEITELDLDTAMTEEQESKILKREKVYDKLLDAYADALKTYQQAQETSHCPLRGLAFCVNIDECDLFAKEAEKYGIRCQVVTGREASGKESDDVIKAAEDRLINGEIDLIVTVKKLAEGWNCKAVNAAIWARACNSAADVIQGIGRTARAYVDPQYGIKKEAFVFETRWEFTTKSGKPRRKRPLGIADALVRNGEDPLLVCSNENGKPLEYEKQLTKEDVIKEIMERFDVATWSMMMYKDKKSLRFGQQPYGKLIARIFSISGDPIGYRAFHLAIGRAIWGDIQDLKELDKNEEKEFIEQEIRERFTPVSWRAISWADKKTLNFNGRPYGIAIAKLFGILGNPTNNHSLHLAIGRAVFEKSEELKEFNKNGITQIIKDTYNPASWSAMKPADKKSLTFLGRKYGVAVATLFGASGNPTHHHSIHLEIGRAVWGEDINELQEEEKIELNKNEITQIIKDTYNPVSWSGMTGTEIKSLQFNGRIYGRAIATLFGVSGNPSRDYAIHLAIGRAIWEGATELQENDASKQRESIEKEIIKRFNAVSWGAMKKTEKIALTFGNKKYGKLIAALFGISGDPSCNHKFHLEIGRLIWGEVPELKEIDKNEQRESIEQEIMKRFTPASWSTMKAADKAILVFQVRKYGLAVATVFGLTGDPVSYKSIHLAIGRAIWGEDVPELQE